MINLGILVFQTLFVCVKIFTILKITEISYQLLIFLVAIILLLLIYALRVNDLFIIIISFLINPFILSFTEFLNFLPYISLYFYVLNILKSKNVSPRKASLYLLPIILGGLFPIKVQGFFESPVKNYFMHLFFSKPLNPSNTSIWVYPSNWTSPFNSFFSSEPFQKIFSGSKDFIFNPPSFLIVFLSNLLFVLFLIMGFYSFRFFPGNGNKKIAKPILGILLSFTALILFILVILQDMPKILNLFIDFFNNANLNIAPIGLWYKISTFIVIGVSLFLFLYIRNKRLRRSNNLGHYGISPFYYLSSFVVVVILFLFMFREKLKFPFKSGMPLSGNFISFLLLIIAIMLVITILIMLRKVAQSNVPEELFGEKTVELRLKFYERSPVDTLKGVEDIKEFVLFFYFAALMILSSKGIKIMYAETPNEFLERLSKLVNIPHFDFMTNIFYATRYSNHDIEDDMYEKIKNYAFEIINFLQNLEFDNKINLQQGVLR